jgi:folate-binding protein YgfZ
MGDDYNPLEAGLIGSIDFAKGCYIGQEVIARLDTYQKVQKRLVKLSFEAGSSVSPGTSLKQEGRVVGKVTSAAVIPTTGETIGLAYVRTKNALPGARLELEPPATGWAEIKDLPQLFGPGEE